LQQYCFKLKIAFFKLFVLAFPDNIAFPLYVIKRTKTAITLHGQMIFTLFFCLIPEIVLVSTMLKSTFRRLGSLKSVMPQFNFLNQILFIFL